MTLWGGGKLSPLIFLLHPLLKATKKISFPLLLSKIKSVIALPLIVSFTIGDVLVFRQKMCYIIKKVRVICWANPRFTTLDE